MTKYRFAIIHMDAVGDCATVIGAAMASMPGFAFAGEHAVGTAGLELDPAVIVAAPVSLRKLLERVAALRRERPDCAVLVAGADFDAAQLAAVFAAGAHDFVDVPVSKDALTARKNRKFIDHLEERGRGRKRGDQDLSACADLADRFGGLAADGREGFDRLCLNVKSGHGKSGLAEIFAHRRPHDAEADHPDGHVILIWHENNPFRSRVQALW